MLAMHSQAPAMLFLELVVKVKHLKTDLMYSIYTLCLATSPWKRAGGVPLPAKLRAWFEVSPCIVGYFCFSSLKQVQKNAFILLYIASPKKNPGGDFFMAM